MTKGIATKKAVLNGVRLTGMHRLLAPVTRGSGVILTFHRVRPAPPGAFQPNANLEVTPEFLGAAVDWMRARGVDIVSLDEGMRRLATGGRRFAVLTFDDGYRDNLQHALPVLKARAAPFTIYVPTGIIDRTANPWWMTLEAIVAGADDLRVTMNGSVRQFATATVAQKGSAHAILTEWLETIPQDAQRAAIDELATRYGFDWRAMVDAEFMTWDEVRRIAAEPLVAIGAHTVNHFALARLTEGRARQEVLEGAQKLQAELGAWPRHFSFPYGYDGPVSPRDGRLLADLGFATAVRTEPGVLTARSLAQPTYLPRVSMNGHFQELRYVSVLLSGVLFAARQMAGRLRRGRGAAMPITAASASSQ